MRKNHLIYVIKLSLIFILIVYLFDKIVYLGLEKLNSNVFTGQSGGKVNQFLKEKDNLDLVVFGSSRANHHINNSKLSDNSFNIGMDGAKIASAATLLLNLPENKKQTVLFHLSPAYAFDSLYNGDDILALSKLSNKNSIIKKEFEQLEKTTFLKKFFWTLNFNGSSLGLLKNYFYPKNNVNEYKGFDPITVTAQQKTIFKNISEKKTNLVCQKNFQLNPIYEKYINDIDNFCKKNNKHLIIFTAPIYSDDCKKDDIALEHFLNLKNITYWNLTDMFQNNRSLENWRDNSHLSHKGAEIFTDSIKAKLDIIK
ncbi:hypothetical protein [Maribacter dokdonensis]|uniref:hypothetical protein n=1 Tax=Maribacter dokdonensis TaxID=320912 RepID=UPI002732F077|nr:hypothetical protein [Maribacter dokdonensis]MDP2527927.1 hypothetical protein [Maribacter dokdonensis]